MHTKTHQVAHSTLYLRRLLRESRRRRHRCREEWHAHRYQRDQSYQEYLRSQNDITYHNKYEAQFSRVHD